MDPSSSMYRSIASPSSLPPRPNKVMLQRQYREKEGECFNTLRDVINDLTGEELQTRHDILRKAIELLLAASERRKRKEAQGVYSTPCETVASPVQDAMSPYIDHSPQLPQWSPSWSPSATDFDVQSACHYLSQSHGQQYLMLDSPSNQPSSQGCGGGWYY